jgi:integrase
MKLKISDASVCALAGPAGKLTKTGRPVKDEIYFAVAPTGLCVRVDAAAQAGSTANKSYLFQYTDANGTKRRIPIGPGSMKSADAIKAAQALLGELALRRDPFADKAQAKRERERDAYTFGQLVADWAEIALRKDPAKSPNYVRDAPRQVRRTFARFLDRPATAIKRADVIGVIDDLVRAGKSPTARTAGVLGAAAFNWAIDRGRLKDNPFAKLPIGKPPPRERVLLDDEIMRLGKATGEPNAFNAVIRLLLLTGQRKEEVNGMLRSELSPDLSIWTLTSDRTKNNLQHIVPLPRQAQAIISAQLPA